MPVIGEILYTPLITIAILAISTLAAALVLNKRSGGGLINTTTGKGSLMYYVSSAPYDRTITANTTWANRVVYISADKANLSNSVGLQLFEPSVLADGTSLTVFNSPASSSPAKISINWVGSPSPSGSEAPKIDISLGTGQGVTLITQRRIGSHYITQVGGTDFRPPDLTPSPLQPRDWTVYRYYAPQTSMCSQVNGVSSSSYASHLDTNSASPCGSGTLTNSGIGYNNSGAQNCTSFICGCPTTTMQINNATVTVYPPPTSVWCNV